MKKEITQEQIQTLSAIRKELIRIYNEGVGEQINYTTIRDLDNTIEEILKTASNYK